jgi:hypothetical protein
MRDQELHLQLPLSRGPFSMPLNPDWQDITARLVLNVLAGVREPMQ